MNMKSVFGIAACGLAATMLMPAAANAQQDRMSSSEKGSLVIFSKVELRWHTDSAPNIFTPLAQDTFCHLTNDFNEDTKVQLYFVNGDDWATANAEITLTQNQPFYWSTWSGKPSDFFFDGTQQSVQPFMNVGNAYPEVGGIENETVYVQRGYVVAWATDSENRPKRHNHLAGDATLINYRHGHAWEYNAFSSQVVDEQIAQGDTVAQDGTINMDGQTYAQPYDQLLLLFHSTPGIALSNPFHTLVVTFTDLTLQIVDADFRQGAAPMSTKAVFNVWNQNEVKFSGTHRCIYCWDQFYLKDVDSTAPPGGPNNFRLGVLGTDVGKARIDTDASSLCFRPGFNLGARALLGVKAKIMLIGGQFTGGVMAAGSNLVGMGVQDATINYDLTGDPSPENLLNELIRESDRTAPAARTSRRGR